MIGGGCTAFKVCFLSPRPGSAAATAAFDPRRGSAQLWNPKSRKPQLRGRGSGGGRGKGGCLPRPAEAHQHMRMQGGGLRRLQFV